MRVEYETACVKFRKDKKEHMRAWQYLNDAKEKGLSYADVIAGLVCTPQSEAEESDMTGVFVMDAMIEEMERIASEMTKHICEYTDKAVSGCAITIGPTKAKAQEVLSHDHHKPVNVGLQNFVMGMDADEDE